MVAAMTRFKHDRLVENGLGENRKSSGLEDILACLSEKMELVRVIFLTEDEVPSEVSHQADVAGNTKFQAGADLAERPSVIIGNRITS